MARSRVNRRNTLDCALLTEIFVDDDSKKATDKRSLQLLRDSERELKHSNMAIANYPPSNSGLPVGSTSPVKPVNDAITTNNNTTKSGNIGQSTGTGKNVAFEERAESFPVGRTSLSTNLTAVPKLVESCNRYMSVTSRPVGCRSSAPASAFAQKDQSGALVNDNSQFDKSMLQSRQDFHETFANLIKLGSSDKQESKVIIVNEAAVFYA